MAVDTRNKRSSAINVGSPWRSMLPEPDGALDQADRQHVAFYYSGILSDAPGETPVTAGGEFIIMFRRRRRGR